MKQKSNAFVTVVVIVGFLGCSLAANRLYDWKAELAPYDVSSTTKFYAGFDKVLSNVSWMSLVQWLASNEGSLTPDQATSIYKKLDALTDLDPRFTDAYLDGALTIASVKPDLAKDLLDKAIKMGAATSTANWRIPFYSGYIRLANNDAKGADEFFTIAAASPEAPAYVKSGQMHARCTAVKNEPVASIHIWYDYYTQLPADQKKQRLMAAGEIREYAKAEAQSSDAQLSSAPDSATRDSIQHDRDWVTKVVDEMNAAEPALDDKPATTKPVI